jgi:hypothetical protein
VATAAHDRTTARKPGPDKPINPSMSGQDCRGLFFSKLRRRRDFGSVAEAHQRNTVDQEKVETNETAWIINLGRRTVKLSGRIARRVRSAREGHLCAGLFYSARATAGAPACAVNYRLRI